MSALATPAVYLYLSLCFRADVPKTFGDADGILSRAVVLALCSM